ncbi:MAG TPA: hypothetical protein VJR27_01840 [Candidatus Saccharimonadales bacterium]|nr:hypothetical protein [Candidatus Saccharimonadales bacterium]
MSFYPTYDLHGQNWHGRHAVLSQLGRAFQISAARGEVHFPCIEGRGPTPVIAGTVEAESSHLDQAIFEIFDLSNKHGRAYRIDYTDKDDGPDERVSYILSAAAGVSRFARLGARNIPLEADDYLGLDEGLTYTIYSWADGARTLERLQDENRIMSLDDYYARHLRNRRQRVVDYLLNLFSTYGEIYGYWY